MAHNGSISLLYSPLWLFEKKICKLVPMSQDPTRKSYWHGEFCILGEESDSGMGRPDRCIIDFTCWRNARRSSRSQGR